MLNISTKGILKGNANPETPGGENVHPREGTYSTYLSPRGYIQYVPSVTI